MAIAIAVPEYRSYWVNSEIGFEWRQCCGVSNRDLPAGYWGAIGPSVIRVRITKAWVRLQGFLEIDRQVAEYQPASDRIRHFREFTIPMSDRGGTETGARCMDCGIRLSAWPDGCPVHNQIPGWNDLVYNNNWEEAIRNLHSTNNFRNLPAASARRLARKLAR